MAWGLRTMSAFDATVLREFTGWQNNTVRLLLREQRGLGAAYLMTDGTWKTADEGTLIGDAAGVILPDGSIEAIVQALAEYQGHTSHADTEARVLREWLTTERERVDRALSKP